MQPDERPAHPAESDTAVSLDETRAGVREKPDVAALASLTRTTLRVMVWHYHDDDVKGDAAAVGIGRGRIARRRQRSAHHYRVDENNSNAMTPGDAWVRPRAQHATAAQEASSPRSWPTPLRPCAWSKVRHAEVCAAAAGATLVVGERQLEHEIQFPAER